MVKKGRLFVSISVLVGLLAIMVNGDAATTRREKIEQPQWAFNATVIEACSCPMFCQCYFNSKPAGHSAHRSGNGLEHFCRFNLAYRVNRGHYGPVRLDGARFWIAGDLGSDYSMGETDWAVLIFDKSLGRDQRNAITTIVGYVYPVKWKSFTMAEGVIDKWEYSRDEAHATVDGGQTAEIKLRRSPSMTNEPIVIKNLAYWSVPRHEGFVLMPNEVQAYRVGSKAFQTRGTSGFMITLDITSKDVK